MSMKVHKHTANGFLWITGLLCGQLGSVCGQTPRLLHMAHRQILSDFL